MAMRSISKQDELTVSFGADKGNLSGLKARLPMPNKNMDSDQINSLRGEADSLALFLAHHKEIVDKKVLNCNRCCGICDNTSVGGVVWDGDGLCAICHCIIALFSACGSCAEDLTAYAIAVGHN